MMDFDKLFVTRNYVGKSIRRDEDVKFVKGEATYIDDIDMDCAHVAFHRSPFAHARIKKIDTSKAEAMKGVLAVITGPEVAKQTNPIPARAITKPAEQYLMANDKVRFVGEPIAAVVAENAYLARDAADLIEVDYEPLEAVVRMDDAIKPDAPVLFEEAGTNILLDDIIEHGDWDKTCKDADLVLKERFRVHRYSSTPLEPWADLAKHDRANDSFTVWSNDQQPGRSITTICHTIKIPAQRLRLIVPDSGVLEELIADFCSHHYPRHTRTALCLRGA